MLLQVEYMNSNRFPNGHNHSNLAYGQITEYHNYDESN